MKTEIIAVGMSGGVDSTVAAAILKEQGHELIGVTAVMSGEYSRCCSTQDIERAEAAADSLGIRHYVVDVVSEFKSNIIDYFVSDYLSARTPSPCVVCNETIKFGVLLEKAMELGASQIATGHYARIERNQDGIYALKRGTDLIKDQSYFLSRLNQEQLARSVFPLGKKLKKDVSQYAADHELMTRKSKESQELCFIESGTHGDWIDLRVLEAAGPGDVLDEEGNKLGVHKGIHHYTIGQRKGLGVAVGKPVYVTKLDAGTNTVVVGDRSETMQSKMNIEDVFWLNGIQPESGFSALCQVRYNHKPAMCRVVPDNTGGSCTVMFDEPQFAITPGQLAVLYTGDEVIGSGWIDLATEC
ncbi:tRNA 2-thiouridine(34) synthase MnmA [PVC group bacterium]|nr:tRNA 2-thiouridine(34) synthase MnmA [PVC group bacterium]